jgi:hypothetical protein
MNPIAKILGVAAVLVVASASSSFALTSGGTTLAGMHNGMQARHHSTMRHHRMMKHRMMKHRTMHKGM